MSARARSWVALLKILAQLSEVLFDVALGNQICAAHHAEVQLAQLAQLVSAYFFRCAESGNVERVCECPRLARKD
jgi:hypothetical protein